MPEVSEKEYRSGKGFEADRSGKEARSSVESNPSYYGEDPGKALDTALTPRRIDLVVLPQFQFSSRLLAFLPELWQRMEFLLTLTRILMLLTVRELIGAFPFSIESVTY